MYCTGCGHPLGGGRFCTHCGRPIEQGNAPDATAERPAVPPPPAEPPPPPPAFTAPSPPRYPLYRDEMPAGPPPAPPTAPAATTPKAPPPRRPAPPWLPWALTVVVVALVALIGGMLLVAGGDDDPATDPAAANSEAESSKGKPSPEPSTPTVTPPPADGPQDIARYVSATVPKTAKPNQDVQGNMVRYDATNMLDGVAESCWRMPGDGSGQSITFTLPEPTEITEVGLINGYAKRAGRFDWYAGNRRILDVEWVFDDGTVVPQSLSETPEMQTIPVDPVTTSSIELRLVTVTKPGKGPSARDNTAISDVRLMGEPSA